MENQVNARMASLGPQPPPAATAASLGGAPVYGRPLAATGLFVAIVALLLALLAASPAQAKVTYAPQNLSAAGENGALPQVAVDPQGRATVIWNRFDGQSTRVQSRGLGAEGTPAGSIQTLSGEVPQPLGFRDEHAADVAVDPQGRATVVWQRFDGSSSAGCCWKIESRRLGADGTLEAIRILSAEGQNALTPRVATDSEGRATIVWRRYDGANYRVQSRRLGADGSPEAIQTLSEAGQEAGVAQVAIDSQGRATVVWAAGAASNDEVQSRRLGADGSPEAIQTLSPPGGNGFLPQIAVDPQGRATVVWIFRAGNPFWIQSRRLGADGAPGPVRTLAQGGWDPQIAVDPKGRATAVWQPPGYPWPVESRRFRADGSLAGPAKTVRSGGPYPGSPQVAVDSQGRATVVWVGYVGTLQRTVQSRRLGADGTPGGVQAVSQPGNAAEPQIAIDPKGRATVVWRRHDGSNHRIQSARGQIVPVTKITKGPKGKAKTRTATFKFRSDEPGSTFECKLDQGKWRRCSSPKTYRKLKPGKHVFRVRGSDRAGSVGKPDKRVWRVVR
jgi:hypothetical protein